MTCINTTTFLVNSAIIASTSAANGGAFPETVAVNLWGLDSIKTKGESVAIVLALVGARPVQEGTGTLKHFSFFPTSLYHVEMQLSSNCSKTRR